MNAFNQKFFLFYNKLEVWPCLYTMAKLCNFVFMKHCIISNLVFCGLSTLLSS